MASYHLIDHYISALRDSLSWRPDVDDLVDEARDHLLEATDRAVAAGQPAEGAQRASLERFGEPAVVARAFATTRRGGLDAPTPSTRSAAGAALAGAVAWAVVALVGVTQAFGDVAGEGLVPYLFLAMAVVVAGTLTLVTLFLLWGRHGRSVGVVGTAGLVVAGLGVLLSTGLPWAVPVWMGLEGIGLALFAAGLGRRGVAPTGSLLALGAAMPAGLGAFALVGALGWGQVDEFGDRALAFSSALTVAGVLMGVALLGLGRWLGSEEPADLGPSTATT